MIVSEFRLLTLQQVYAFGKGQVPGDGMKVAKGLIGDHADSLEQEDLSCDLQAHRGDLPASVAHVGLLYAEVTPFIEVADNAPADGDVPEQRAVDHSHPVRSGIDPQISSHSLQYLLRLR